MAEFQEVIEQFKRLCDSANQDCSICGLRNMFCCMKDVVDNSVEFEKRVMAWASEHPVVYPTWEEWLIKIGGAVKKLYAQQYHYEAAQPTQLIEVVEVLDEPIPADMAEKLGVKPKEGV